MKIKKIGSNQTELCLANGTIVFFSYETPVAAFVPGNGYLRTMSKYSVTTTKHLNKWFQGVKQGLTIVPQHILDQLVEG